MSELQAAVEFQVELSKFYNVDLFQRGYYQIRTSLKTAPKSPAKIEVSLPRNSECDLVCPAYVINGVAVSKTFQILYRNEDMSVDDVVLFKAHMLVDAQKIEESIEEADFQLAIDLWFTDEELGKKGVISPDQQEKLQCISSRTLKLHFSPTSGLHHHVPVLFDYFHLSVICVTVHGTLIALHQPYIYLPKQPKSAWTNKNDHSTLESVLFGSNTGPTMVNNRYSVSPRLQQACQAHRSICNILLSAYESLQCSLETLMVHLPSDQRLSIEHKDCHRKLETLSEKAQSFRTEEDLLQAAQSDVAQLCAENVILWTQYLELLTLNEKVTHNLAREHHIQRIKRFAEGFFTRENLKHEVLACYEPSTHGHSDLATVVRASEYFNSIPPLAVECEEMDGDQTTLPLIFEDIFCEAQPVKKFKSVDDVDCGELTEPMSMEIPDRHSAVRTSAYSQGSRSDNSSGSADSSSPRFKRGKKKNFIKNIKPEAFKRPSYQNPDVENNVAIDRTAVTLVGFRKINQNTHKTQFELGTLSPAPAHGSLMEPAHLYAAASMPVLPSNGHTGLTPSGSMPELCQSASNQATVTPDLVATCMLTDAQGTGSGDSPPRERASTISGTDTTRTDNINTVSPVGGANKSIDSDSSSSSLSANAIQNGYIEEPDFYCDSAQSDTASQGPTADPLTDSSQKDDTNAVPKDVVDYGGLAEDLSKALGESEGNTRLNLPARQDSTASSRSSSSQTHKQQQPESDSGVGESTGVPASVEATEPGVPVDSTNTPSQETTEQSSDSDKPTETITDSSIKSTESTTDATSKSTETSNNPSTNTDTTTNTTTNKTLFEEVSDKDEGLVGEKYDDMSFEQQQSYLSGTCTMLELLREEYKEEDSEDSGGGMLGQAVHGQRGPWQSSEGDSSALGIARRDKSKGIPDSPSKGQIRLVSPVPDKTINFITAKENLRKKLLYQGIMYSDFPTQVSHIPYFWPPEFSLGDGIHLIICVHGLDGNSADLRLVRTYLELALPGYRVDFLMSERNQPDTFADFNMMTDKLVKEILDHIELYNMNPTKISFVGHSLGNLIIRSALSRPEMALLLPRLYTFLSLSGPHLGTLFNTSGLVNMGMWFMQKWKKSGSLLQLSLKDHPDPRKCFLYELSQKPGMEFFRNILFVSSQQDRYVPYHSSRVELCKSAVRDSSGLGAVYTEMVNNILQPLVFKKDITVARYDVFHALPSTANTLIGRAAHIAVLDSEIFIEKFITVSALKYFK